jgi:parallel beta-helix repeat protein
MDDDLILDDDDFLLSAPTKPSEGADSVPLMPASVREAIQPESTNENPVAGSAGQQTRRFGRKLCPRCMHTVEGFTEQVRGTEVQYFCPSCSEAVQFRYARDYDHVSRVKLSLAGMSGHGKTMFLRGIYAHLNSLGRRWPGFRFAPLSDDDATAFNNATGDSSRGGMADPSQLTERPVGFQLSGVPGAGDVHLLIYDISGEAFDTSTKLTKHAFFIPKSEVITLILSLSDLSAGHQLAFLLSRLVDAIRAKGEDPRTKSLVVVLTKGDQLRFDETLPASAESFLSNEVFSDPRNLNDLQRLSDDLAEWLRNHPDNYWNFVESAADEFQNVRYTVISSLGSDPGSGSGRTHVQINPRNVVSPLLWLFRFSLPAIRLRSDSRESVFYDFCEAHQAALAVAGGQDAIRLEMGPGDYQLRQPVQFNQKIEIKGAGHDVTRLISQRGNCFISVTGGTFAAAGISFQANGMEPGVGLKVCDTKIQLSKCSFSGANRNRGERTLGHGLLVDGSSSGEIEQCEFIGNQGNGLLASGRAQLTVRKCLAERNGIGGLTCTSRSSVKATSNRTHLNKQGIYVLGNANAELVDNSCCNNESSGIWFTGSATGIVKKNTCSNDSKISEQAAQLTGVMLTGHVSVDLQMNKCFRNKGDGIQADSDARSQIKGNVAKDNGRCGIGVYERANVSLDSNHCNNNQFGIYIDKTAKGTRDMKNNDCMTNREYGLKDLRSWRWLIQ